VREETRLTAAARQVLRAGDASRALALLDQAQSQFPYGALVQEREALAMEALMGLGQRAAAVERARVFLQNHPESPYASWVSGIISKH
jgi:outer membrane protein assembly factor BamD (BamD/ComL family)